MYTSLDFEKDSEEEIDVQPAHEVKRAGGAEGAEDLLGDRSSIGDDFRVEDSDYERLN